MTTFAPINSESPYLPISIQFDRDSELLVQQLNSMYNSISYRMNNREVSIYDLQETLTGQKWTDSTNLQIQKETYRKVFEFGAIAVGATLNIAHGIDTISQFTRFFGSFITAADNRPLPYIDEGVVTNQVSVKRVGLNLLIINGATAPAITSGILVVEYLKN